MENKNIQKIETLEGNIHVEISRISKDLHVNQFNSGAIIDDIVVIPKENIKEFMQALNKVVYAGELQPKYALKCEGAVNELGGIPKVSGIDHEIAYIDSRSAYRSVLFVFKDMNDLTLALKHLKERNPSIYYQIITVY